MSRPNPLHVEGFRRGKWIFHKGRFVTIPWYRNNIDPSLPKIGHKYRVRRTTRAEKVFIAFQKMNPSYSQMTQAEVNAALVAGGY